MKSKIVDIIKKTLQYIIYLLVLGVIIWLVIWSPTCTTEKEKQENEEKLLTEETVVKLIEKWDALEVWKDELLDNFRMGSMYTAELQNIFLNNENRPIYISLGLNDIVKKDNSSYIAYLEKAGMFGSRIIFVVSCSLEHYQKLILKERSPLRPNKFGLIIQVQRIYSSQFFNHEKYEDDSNYEIQVDSIPVVEGTCLDLIYLGLDYFNF